MIVQNLEHIAFEELIVCFLKAFNNYYVEMPTDISYYRKRFKAAKVKYDYSYGMFDGKQLVGFIVHGIDRRNGDLVAYNTGTGVLPEYRGQRIVQQIYKHAIPELKEKGVSLCSLEVIKENEIALKSYQRIGFEIVKHFKCFNGELAIDKPLETSVKAISFQEMQWEKLPNQPNYSWDFHKNSLEYGDFNYYLVSAGKSEIGYFIINPENGYLAQFDVFNNAKNSYEQLFSAIGGISTTLKINNVDERLIDKCNYLFSLGLENTIDQFEMEMKI